MTTNRVLIGFGSMTLVAIATAVITFWVTGNPTATATVGTLAAGVTYLPFMHFGYFR